MLMQHHITGLIRLYGSGVRGDRSNPMRLLTFNPETSQVCFDWPYLPAFLDQVQLMRIGLNAGTADIELRRAGDQVLVNVERHRGTIHVMTSY
jgi:hypothetical protein